MAVTQEVFVLDNGACTAKVGVSNAERPRYVTVHRHLSVVVLTLESLKAVYLQKMGGGGRVRVRRFRFDLAAARKPYVLKDQRLKTLCMNMSV
jgi:hypothetical protein